MIDKMWVTLYEAAILLVSTNKVGPKLPNPKKDFEASQVSLEGT